MLNELKGHRVGSETLGRCKRDYEQEIKSQKEQLTKTLNLKTALLDYAGPFGEIRGKSAELLGELVAEEINITCRIAIIIEEQASDPEE